MYGEFSKWGTAEGLVEIGTYQTLTTLTGLRKGRSAAKEMPPVMPVADEVVERTLEHVGPIVRDMIKLQRLTGCRPDEICQLRPRDVERGDSVWTYRPRSHKTEHHGRERVIFIGPVGQAILNPYLLRDPDSYCFAPSESNEQHRRARHLARKTPLSCGNRPGSNRKRRPKRTPGDRYDVPAYRRAIHRACDNAFPAPPSLGPREGETHGQWRARLSDRQRADLAAWQKEHRWSPNRLRHTAATVIRSKFGLESARVVLGHSNVGTTELYGEKDMRAAAAIIQQIG